MPLLGVEVADEDSAVQLRLPRLGNHEDGTGSLGYQVLGHRAEEEAVPGAP